MDMIVQYWWAVLIGAIALVLLLWLLLRPRQRVTLTDSTPVRPHMAQSGSSATSSPPPVTTTPLHQALAHPGGEADDFSRMKGVGPKFATALTALGITRFEQLAALDREDARKLDEHLGAFRGRIERDRIVEQARLLGADDQAAFEAKFGKL